MGATHSFVSTKRVKKLNLKVSVMNGTMVIDTPTNVSVTNSLLCVNFPLTIYSRVFGIDLVCLPISKLNVILGMNRLKFNHVHINFFDKTVMFPEIGESGELVFIYANKVEEFLKDEARVFVMFSFLRIDNEAVIVELLVVCNSLKVFPYDISELPP
ncbi:uncharacterized protein LOC127103356 [Lathyrus oleraceus]|uniref:uncharacterized protein LOC127103356 n=1 Tax=Pisum sativum TaxID=3888 RepID=UPI0021CEA94A|nr:uncharacterized protein LOC127103356 [Pisum sativum]